MLFFVMLCFKWEKLLLTRSYLCVSFLMIYTFQLLIHKWNVSKSYFQLLPFFSDMNRWSFTFDLRFVSASAQLLGHRSCQRSLIKKTSYFYDNMWLHELYLIIFLNHLSYKEECGKILQLCLIFVNHVERNNIKIVFLTFRYSKNNRNIP